MKNDFKLKAEGYSVCMRYIAVINEDCQSSWSEWVIAPANSLEQKTD
jgi:hypothetical protein